MRCRNLFCHRFFVFAAVALGVGLPGTSSAQRLEDGSVRFSQKARGSYALRRDLFAGSIAADPRSKEHQEAIEVAAMEYTYPLVWLSETKAIEAGSINKVVDDFTTQLSRLTRYPEKTAVMQQMFCRQVTDRVKEVIDKGKAIAGVNAAMLLFRITERPTDRGTVRPEKVWATEVLPRLAEGNGDYMANTILEVLKSPKANDGVKYYLYGTLSNLMGIPSDPPLLKKETEEKVLLAVLAEVNKPVHFPKNAPPAEVEGYKVLRREALKVVAQTTMPRLPDGGQPALTLARFAGADTTIKPAPRLDERIEATIGLTRLIARLGEKPGDLQIDYAAYQIARTVQAFAAEANMNIETTGYKRSRAWKLDAARMIEGIFRMQRERQSPYMTSLIKQCLDVLLPIEEGGLAQANNLSNWLDDNPPASKALFRDDMKTTVTPQGSSEG